MTDDPFNNTEEMQMRLNAKWFFVRFTTWVLFIVLVGLNTPGLLAATIHVNPAGNDGNPGSAEQPVASLHKALELVAGKKESCEIILHAGVYPGSVQIGLQQDRGVGPLPPLLLTAAKKADGSFEEVVFDGGRKISKAEPVTGKVSVFKTTGTYNLRYTRPQMWEADARIRYELVADLAAVEQYPASFWCNGTEVFLHTSDGRSPEMHDIGITGDDREGIMVWRQNTTIRGLHFRNFLAWAWSAGVVLRAANSAVEDCQAWNCVRGFELLDEGVERMRISRSRTDDCGGGVYVSGKHGIVEDCRLFLKRDRFLIPVDAQDDCGIQFYYPASEGEARRNLCVGFANGIFIKCLISPFTVEYNSVLNGITHGIGCTGWHTNTVCRYNIVTGFSWPLLFPEQMELGTVVDYNCFWQCSEPSALQKCIEAPRKAGTGEHNIVADPRFAGPIAGDYRLLTDSPCLKRGPNGETCGAFGPVATDFKDVQPPVVVISLAQPAKRAGGNGELYFERDPWIGGGRNLVRELAAQGHADEWVTPDSQLGLLIQAEDAASKPSQMKVRVGNKAWSEPEPYAARKDVTLPEGTNLTAVCVAVSDTAGNWSAPKTLMVRLLAKPPKLNGPPVVYANDNGAVVSFETDSPCLAKIEFGTNTSYGTVVEQPRDVQRTWLSNDGGDWVEVRSKPRVTNYLVLLKPAVDAGKTYHYRIILEDEVANKSVTDDAVFTVAGAAKSYFVSPRGEDADGRGVREKPWRTIQFAVDRALPGDRIILLPGLYPGETKLTHGGLAGAPIAIEADQPGTVILDGRHEASACLRLEKAGHVAIKGLEIRWFAQAGVYLADSPDVTASNCKIWNGWRLGSGIFAHRSPGLVADHDVMYDLEHGISLLQSPRSRITFNTILLNNYGAVNYFKSAAGAVCRNNSFVYSGNDRFTIDGDTPDEVATFDSDYNNLGSLIAEYYVKYNADAKIGIGTPEEFVAKDDFLKTHITNKAVIWKDGKRFMSLKAWQEATGKDMHSIFKDPLYVDAEHGDFRLQPGSPNIGAGEGGATIGALGVKEK